MPSLFDLNLLEIESLCNPHFLTTLSLTLCGSCHCLKLGFRDLWKLTVGWQSPSGLMHHFPTKTATLKSICHCTKLGAASHLVSGVYHICIFIYKYIILCISTIGSTMVIHHLLLGPGQGRVTKARPATLSGVEAGPSLPWPGFNIFNPSRMTHPKNHSDPRCADTNIYIYNLVSLKKIEVSP